MLRDVAVADDRPPSLPVTARGFGMAKK